MNQFWEAINYLKDKPLDLPLKVAYNDFAGAVPLKKRLSTPCLNLKLPSIALQIQFQIRDILPIKADAHWRASSMFTAGQKKQKSKVGPKVAKEATGLPRKCQKAKGLHGTGGA